MDSTETDRFDQLPTEARNPRSARLEELPTRDMLAVINDEDATVAEAIRAALDDIAAAVDSLAECFARGGRIFFIGAGTSGRLGVLDASEIPPTFGVEPGRFVGLIAGGDRALREAQEGTEDSAAQGAQDLRAHALTAEDAVVGIAASGRTPYVLGALAAARGAGAFTVGLTCAGAPGRPLSPVALAAERPIELATGAEVITGSTRMKAGSATKMVLHMMSTGVMVRAGAVRGNLMINVQPTNAKLRDRAERILRELTGCDKDAAERLLREYGSVPAALDRVNDLPGRHLSALEAKK